jgi:hypothetical protein
MGFHGNKKTPEDFKFPELWQGCGIFKRDKF